LVSVRSDVSKLLSPTKKSRDRRLAPLASSVSCGGRPDGVLGLSCWTLVRIVSLVSSSGFQVSAGAMK
jgi:hypothetical protein